MTNSVMEISIHQENVKRCFYDSIKNKNAVREQKQMLKDAYENDQEYENAKIGVDNQKKKLAAVKNRIDSLPAIVAIKNKMTELKEDGKDIQESLFAHLEGYVKHTGHKSIEIEGEIKNIVTSYSLK